MEVDTPWMKWAVATTAHAPWAILSLRIAVAPPPSNSKLLGHITTSVASLAIAGVAWSFLWVWAKHRPQHQHHPVEIRQSPPPREPHPPPPPPQPVHLRRLPSLQLWLWWLLLCLLFLCCFSCKISLARLEAVLLICFFVPFALRFS